MLSRRSWSNYCKSLRTRSQFQNRSIRLGEQWQPVRSGVKRSRETAEACPYADGALAGHRERHPASIDLHRAEIVEKPHELSLPVCQRGELAAKNLLDMRKRAIHIRELRGNLLQHCHPRAECDR